MSNPTAILHYYPRVSWTIGESTQAMNRAGFREMERTTRVWKPILLVLSPAFSSHNFAPTRVAINAYFGTLEGGGRRHQDIHQPELSSEHCCKKGTRDCAGCGVSHLWTVVPRVALLGYRVSRVAHVAGGTDSAVVCRDAKKRNSEKKTIAAERECVCDQQEWGLLACIEREKQNSVWNGPCHHVYRRGVTCVVLTS